MRFIGLVNIFVGLAASFQQATYIQQVLEGGIGVAEVLLTDSYWENTLNYNLTEIEKETKNLSIILVDI